MAMKTLNTVHVRYDGRSWDLPLHDLGVTMESPDVEVQEALARHFDVARQTFRAYVIERHRAGSMTVRPEAVFG